MKLTDNSNLSSAKIDDQGLKHNNDVGEDNYLKSISAIRYNKPSNKKIDVINKARNIIRGERTLDSKELNSLINELVLFDQFSYATEILLIKIKQDKNMGLTVRLKDYESVAKFIYKDHSLPSSFKYKKALEELSNREDLTTTEKCETLGLVGAIYKRKWQFDHQFQNLILSRYYYRRGFERWKEYINDFKNEKRDKDKNDDGYNAINYSYINELMAVDKMEEHGFVTGLTEGIKGRFNEAKDTRLFILEQFIDPTTPCKLQLPENNYQPWIFATVAEAYFGLYDYKHAYYFIQKYLNLPQVHEWEVRSFSQQIMSLSYLQNFCSNFQLKYEKTNLPWKEELVEITSKMDFVEKDRCIELFKDPKTFENLDFSGSLKKPNADEVKLEGKLGLALSGGGFRYALFHIGVLAALAEKDELKNVEVISCVSGGSIIGSFYYLKLKKLLEEKNDSEKLDGNTDFITRQDYIKIVKEIEVDFLTGVQKNLRVRIFGDLIADFKMFTKHYSRTHRLGELYEEYFFKDIIKISRTQEDILKGKKEDEIYMSDLFIKPKGSSEDFSIEIDNWKRKNKVPQLVLNSTSLNTGHNWQFTASWMGEPPGNIQPDIDVKPRLRRMYYEEAPIRYRNFRLGHAVGASSCVPVMFRPMPLFDLYPGIDLQLIDGGVHDNQGIAALIEQECKNMIISDGSGQMATDKASSKNNASLFYRSDTILQERIRELEFMDIKQRNATTQIDKLITVHLKSDLENRPVSWKYCKDPARSIMYSNAGNSDTDLTKYGILRTVQLYLSQIRTDLDSYNDTESFALMYSGYEQIIYEYKCQEEKLNQFENKVKDEELGNWNFLRIKDYVTLPEKAAEKKKIFVEASRVPFKLFFLSPSVKAIVLIFGFVALIGLLYIAFYDKIGMYSMINIAGKAVILSFIIFLIGLVFKAMAAILSIKTTIRKNLLFAFLVVPLWLLTKLYIMFFNNIYNEFGKVDNND